MKKIIFSAVLIGSMLMSAGSVFAAGNGNGFGNCDRLRDGSCLVTLGDQIQDRDQLRDGSCQTLNCSGDRDRLRDVSCTLQ